jgi:type I restriction enzyme S subunit
MVPEGDQELIDALNPYPAMKDSGLPWAGQVPSHWELVPNRALLRKRKVLVGDRHNDYRLLSLTKAGVIVRDISTGRGKFSADMGTSQEVREGDLVFCLFDVPETPRTVGLSKHHGMITGAYTVLECKDKQLARFLEAFYIAMDDRKLLSPLYSGLRNTIPPPVLLGQKTPLPPAHEQAAIVSFLDHADRKIRRYIRAKQKLIKLLEEQKHAIILRAITRGLDPNVRLKPSGVEWLGDVPEHWELRKLGTLFRRRGSGTTPAGDDYYGGEIPWVMTGDLNDGLLGTTKRTVTNAAVLDHSALRVYQRGALIVAMYGATIGKSGVLMMDACTNQACCVLAEPIESVSALFLQAIVRVARSYLIELGYGGGQPNINAEIVRSLRVPVPPIEEQEAILCHIADGSANSAISVAAREIALLREYHTRLIADVVTGKLDVREAAARLPEDVDPLDTEDPGDKIEDLEPEEDGGV